MLLTPSSTVQHAAAGKRLPGAVPSGTGGCLGRGGLHRVLEGSRVTLQHPIASPAPPTQWVQSGRGARGAPEPMGAALAGGRGVSPGTEGLWVPWRKGPILRGWEWAQGGQCHGGTMVGDRSQHRAGKAGAQQRQLRCTSENHQDLAKITRRRCWLSCCLRGSSLTLAQGWHPKVPAPPLPAGSPWGGLQQPALGGHMAAQGTVPPAAPPAQGCPRGLMPTLLRDPGAHHSRCCCHHLKRTRVSTAWPWDLATGHGWDGPGGFMWLPEMTRTQG